ncbi:Neurotransmitter-gated ion-channel transmembrane domain, partial [Trinorchestia longiramus]
GEKNLLQYSVQRVSAKVINQSLCPALLVELAFQNRSVYYVFYTFLPSLMLMVVGYMTFYFPLDDFQDRIMVALTAMLVQTTFFTQVGDHLPRTSYLKLIDVWCVLCIAMLFCIILALVIINHFYV